MSKSLSSFKDAYDRLDEAAQDLKTPALTDLVSQEIESLKQTVTQELRGTQEQAVSGAAELAVFAKDLGRLGLGHAEEVAESVGRSMKERPLLYAGGFALGALALGVLYSRRAQAGRELPPVLDSGSPDDEFEQGGLYS